MQTYEPMWGTTINISAEEMVALANKTNDTVKANFNDIEITVNPGDDPNTIIVEFYQSESRRRHEEYMMLEGALKTAPEKMTLRDEEGWKQIVEKNSDGFGSGAICFAERWARLMEGRIVNGDTVEACADETSSLADNEGITYFMYGCAVSILSQVWIHGDELRRWHNLKYQIGNEGEKANESGGVLNPALLSIG